MRAILALLSITMLLSCTKDSGTHVQNDTPEFILKASVVELGEKLLIDVYEGEYASGEYLVIIPDFISITDNNGKNLTRGDIKVGDTLEIIYNGQVMMSYPAQIVARKIKVL